MSAAGWRFLADENFNGRILRALQRRLPALPVLRVQDTELYQQGDPEVLAWAATEGCSVLTHDLATRVGVACERVEAGLPMPGVIATPTTAPIGQVVEDLELLVATGDLSEVHERVLFLPF